MANKEKGIDNATANPNIPIAGPAISPIDAAWTKSVPIIGPVQEKDTKTKVNAIKEILKIPVVASALLSSFVVHEAGNVNSNAPKNDMANSTNNAKNIILNIAFVAKLFKALAPKIAVIIKPNTT